MIKKIFDKVVSALLPDGEGEEGHNDKKPVRPRQRVVNKLKEHFLTEMENETTTKSLLYHTSYTVYVREKEYDRLSPSFALTVDDAIKEFVEELRKAVKNYPGYQNHSKYWEMQLVAIPEDSEIEGISTEVMAENPIIIRSKLFADNLYDSPAHDDPNIQDDVHYVTTIHTKDSSKELPNAINLAALKGLTELAKDKYRVEFNLKDVLGTANPDLVDKSNNNIHATLHLVVGNFI
ncbi:MAG: hypothetical protein K2N91_01530, partial [Muribaculaceae bacterium]|nr:hypothetical protein [Muribaculaceae bacterium]